MSLGVWCPIDRPYWLCMLVLAACDVLLLPASNIHASIDWEMVSIGALFLVVGRVIDRLRCEDRSLVLVMESLAAFLLSVTVVGPLAYVATRSPFPAVDGAINVAEASIGFDPAGLRAFLAAHPWLWRMLGDAYASFSFQYLFLLAVMPRTRFPTRGFALMRQSAVVLCVSTSWRFCCRRSEPCRSCVTQHGTGMRCTTHGNCSTRVAWRGSSACRPTTPPWR